MKQAQRLKTGKRTKFYRWLTELDLRVLSPGGIVPVKPLLVPMEVYRHRALCWRFRPTGGYPLPAVKETGPDAAIAAAEKLAGKPLQWKRKAVMEG